MRFISSRRVCKCPSAGRLFFKASRRKEVHCWIRLPSMNTSTIYKRREKSDGYLMLMPARMQGKISKAWEPDVSAFHFT